MSVPGLRLTPTAAAELERLLRGGVRATRAAAAVGCHVSTAVRTARRLGIAVPRSGRPPRADITPAAVRAAVEVHGTVNAAARALRCGYHTAARRMEATW